jgi:GTPase Era involved in 16S rRNA processing
MAMSIEAGSTEVLEISHPLAVVPYGRQEEESYKAAKFLQSEGQKSVVTFGITGHGKSTFLNFILQSNYFKTSVRCFLSSQSLTKKTQSVSAVIDCEQWVLIDTPGFLDSHNVGRASLKSANEIVEQEKHEFTRNIMQAYLEAGKEISAFIFVYSGATRWALEMNEQMKFLESIKFPWDHCILVITHADTAFEGLPEEKRYEELHKAVTIDGPTSDQLPDQLKRLILKVSHRIVIVEGKKTDKEYQAAVMARFTRYVSSILAKENGPHRNETFVIFDGKYTADCHKAYMELITDKNCDALERLREETKAEFREFVIAGKEAVEKHQEVIGHLEKIAELAENKIFTPAVAASTAIGVSAIAAGVVATAVGIVLLPVTFGVSGIAAGIGVSTIIGGAAVATGGVGLGAGIPFLKALRNNLEVRKAQKVLDESLVNIKRLYDLYQLVQDKIEKGEFGHDHLSVKDSLFAHLAAIHLHSSADKSTELFEAAQRLSVFHMVRIAAMGEAKSKAQPDPMSATCTLPEPVSANYALPVGFKLLASTMDIAQTVGATLEITQITKKTKTADMTILRETCIKTLQKECETIKELCSL